MLTLVKLHKWKSALLLSIIILLLVLPYLVKTVAQQSILDYTKPYGIKQVSIDSVGFNLFKGSISLHNLNLYTDKVSSESQPEKGIIHIGELSANLEWLGLLQKRIWIQSLYFAETNLPFTLNENNQLLLANIPLTQKTLTEEPEPSETTEMVILPGLDNVQFHNIHLSLAYKNETSSFTIQDLNLEHLYAWSEDYGRLQFKAYFNKSLIQSNLQLHLFADEPKIIGTLKTAQLNVSELKQFIPKTGIDFNAILDTDITFTLAQTDNGITLFQQGNISLSQVDFTQQNTQATLKQLDWKGDLFYNESNSKKIDFNGKLSVQELAAQHNHQKLEVAQTSLAGKTQLSLATETHINTQQTINISGIKLSDHITQQTL